MRELPVALFTGSIFDDLRCACEHTLSHTPTQTDRERNWVRLCINCIWPRKWEHTRESVDRHLQFSFNINVLFCAITIRAVSSLVFSHKAWSEIWLYLSVPLLLDKQPHSRSAPMYAFISSAPAHIQTLIHTLYVAVLWITVYNLFHCRSIESVA